MTKGLQIFIDFACIEREVECWKRRKASPDFIARRGWENAGFQSRGILIGDIMLFFLCGKSEAVPLRQ